MWVEQTSEEEICCGYKGFSEPAQHPRAMIGKGRMPNWADTLGHRNFVEIHPPDRRVWHAKGGRWKLAWRWGSSLRVLPSPRRHCKAQHPPLCHRRWRVKVASDRLLGCMGCSWRDLFLSSNTWITEEGSLRRGWGGGRKFGTSAGGLPTDLWDYPTHGSFCWAMDTPKASEIKSSPPNMLLPAVFVPCQRRAARRACSGKRTQNLEL